MSRLAKLLTVFEWHEKRGALDWSAEDGGPLPFEHAYEPALPPPPRVPNDLRETVRPGPRS